MDKIIERVKNLKKAAYLNKSYTGIYAFVGIGGHSINNLYPVLNYLRVPLKYIVTKSEKNASSISKNFNGIIGTNDLDKVLNDEEVKGIFICTSPKSHFSLVKKSLLHNKHVFVEKPPCTTSQELNELVSVQEKTNKTCLVGLQKRYAPAVSILKKQLGKSVISYNYRFVTGSYPEGDSLFDLFIHPLDLAYYLFGDYTVASVQHCRDGKDLSVYLHLSHNGIIGNIELSTCYSWKEAQELLTVNSKQGIYELCNMEKLNYSPKQGKLFSIPQEKIINRPANHKVLFNRNNFNPVMQNNQLYTAGYYDEIVNFVTLCEGKEGNNVTPLKELNRTFLLINEIKNKLNV